MEETNTAPHKSNSKFGAMVQLKCPRCREGEMFMYPLSNIFKFYKMYKECKKCGLQYEPEPGFYFGAMYISYGFNIALMLTIFITINILIERPEVWVYLVAIITPSLLLVPINLRISRAIMLHLFGGASYEPERLKKS